MTFSAAGFSRGPGSHRRVIAGIMFLVGLVIVLVALQAQDSVRESAIRSWIVQAEDLGAFAVEARGCRCDLLLVDRLTRLSRRDDVTYALILDEDGRASFHSNAADVGRVYTSVYARCALDARKTLIQDIPSHGVLEIDVPLERGVLRVGFTFQGLSTFFRWLWGGVAISCLFIAVMAGLLAFGRG